MKIIECTRFDDFSFDLHIKIEDVEMYQMEKVLEEKCVKYRISNSLWGEGYYHILCSVRQRGK
jgi:hypothetical protein